MSPRDYGQRDEPRGGERRQRTRRAGDASAMPGWVWLFAGLCIGLAIAAFTYIGRPVGHDAKREAAEQAAEDTPAAAKKPVAKTAKDKDALELPPQEKPRFSFYEQLPVQEVVVPRDGGKPRDAAPRPAETAPDAKTANAPPSASAPPAATATASEVYFIRVASYRSQADAENQKAALALIGAEARVEKVTIDNRDTFYRVIIGPEKNAARAQNLMQRLEENGIQAMLVRSKS